MTVTGENTVFYRYDNANRLTNVTQGTFTSSLFYDDAGRRTKFTAREDDGTGLYYYRARYYQPALGRFVSEDPLEYFGRDVNLFAYVESDPIDEVDPLGLVSPQCGFAIIMLSVKLRLLTEQFVKYNPVTDLLGGVPIKRGGVPIGKDTVPYGHAKRITNIFREVERAWQDVVKFCSDNDNNQCKKPGSGPGLPPLPTPNPGAAAAAAAAAASAAQYIQLLLLLGFL
jgi:RHS repeat-associated protein